MSEELVEQFYLENKDPPHDKFYEISIVYRLDKFCIDLRHGKIGASGRLMKNRHTFTQRKIATTKANSIKDSKLNAKKGYKEVKRITKNHRTKKIEEKPMTFKEVRLFRFANLE